MTGDVEIMLNGKAETLRPSLGAAKRVVAAGLGKKTSEVEDAVYRTGMPKLGADVVGFVNILANGGKPFETDTPSEGETSGEA